MAKKQTVVEEKAAQLATMEAQRDALLERIKTLEAALDNPHLGGQDPAGAVANLKDQASELASSRGILSAVDAQIRVMQSDLTEAKAAEAEAVCVRLWPAEHVKMQKVVDLVGQLSKALDDLATTSRQIRGHGGMTKSQTPSQLILAVNHCLDYWRAWGSWHDEGGSFRQDHAAQVKRWKAGEREPATPMFSSLMEDPRARHEHERRYGVRVKGHGAEVYTEPDWTGEAIREIM